MVKSEGVQGACEKIVNDELNWRREQLEEMIKKAEDSTKKQDAERMLVLAHAAVKTTEDQMKDRQNYLAELRGAHPPPDHQPQLEKHIKEVEEALEQDHNKLKIQQEQVRRARDAVDMFSEACIKVMKKYLEGVETTSEVTNSKDLGQTVRDNRKAGAGGAGAAYKPKQDGVRAGKQPKQGRARAVPKPLNAGEGGASLRRSQRVRFLC